MALYALHHSKGRAAGGRRAARIASRGERHPARRDATDKLRRLHSPATVIRACMGHALLGGIPFNAWFAGVIDEDAATDAIDTRCIRAVRPATTNLDTLINQVIGADPQQR